MASRMLGARRGGMLGSLRLLTTARVLFGSQTGNAALFASQLVDKLAERAVFDDVKLSAMNDTPVDEALAEPGPLLLVCSVFGEGVPPDNATQFAADLLARRTAAPAPGPYAVFGLGDSRYAMERFNVVGRRLDAQLEALGRTRLVAFVPGDAAGDVEGDFERWSDALLQQLQPVAVSTAAPPAPVDEVVLVPGPPSTTQAQPQRAGPWDAANPLLVHVEATRSANPDAAAWNARPCAEVWLSAPALTYQTGDYLGVYAPEAPEHVDELLTLARLSGTEHFSLERHRAAQALGRGGLPAVLSARDYLTHWCDLSHPLPSAAIRAHVLPRLAGAERDALARALEDRGEALGRMFHWRTAGQALAQFATLRVDLDLLVGLLPPVKPPLYSIGSSALCDPHRVRLVVGQTLFGAPGQPATRGGRCSSYLTTRCRPGDALRVFVKQSDFALPLNPATPVVMVAVGSGIAPFVAFLEERVRTRAPGANTLYFGCMRRDWDHLYREQLDAWVREGHLQLHVAYSHADPSAPPVFAQHLMQRQRDALWSDVHERHAALYVCGHTRLGAGVTETLLALFRDKLGGPPEVAKAYYDMLYEQGRLKLDVFA